MPKLDALDSFLRQHDDQLYPLAALVLAVGLALIAFRFLRKAPTPTGEAWKRKTQLLRILEVETDGLSSEVLAQRAGLAAADLQTLLAELIEDRFVVPVDGDHTRFTLKRFQGGSSH